MIERILSLDEIRTAIAPIAKQYNIPAIFVFGSYARGTATPDSDIDIIVDTTGTQLHGMFGLGMLYTNLEEALARPSISLL